MQKRIPFYFFLLLSALSLAQIGGRTTYQFLNLVSSPRQAALGGKVITNYDHDVSQALFNPASINIEMDNKLALNYVNYLGDINYGSAAYAYSWDGRENTFFAGVTYINYGTFDGRDEQGNPTGDFTGNEVALSVGYAKNIPWTKFHIGANAKVISSRLEQFSSFGAAIDVGVFYRDEEKGFNAALVVRNFGAQLTPYNEVKENLPFEVSLGLSQRLQNVPVRWHLTFENLQNWNLSFSNPNRAQFNLNGGVAEEEVGFVQEFLRHVVVGAELFPERAFSLRLGYNFRRAEELRIVDQRTFAGISAGFGLKMNRLRFNYTHARYSTAGNTGLFGLAIDFL
ncbi:type IX secretion system protein PorQ [Sungkyunkwania multivorans]|uniref:Type IX secretion system protein PorQ n=1 Tax=Sungkyunkwania multivorans TaxID=1173618 RepID=A0ABW3CX45_9FLAO